MGKGGGRGGCGTGRGGCSPPPALLPAQPPAGLTLPHFASDPAGLSPLRPHFPTPVSQRCASPFQTKKKKQNSGSTALRPLRDLGHHRRRPGPVPPCQRQRVGAPSTCEEPGQSGRPRLASASRLTSVWRDAASREPRDPPPPPPPPPRPPATRGARPAPTGSGGSLRRRAVPTCPPPPGAAAGARRPLRKRSPPTPQVCQEALRPRPSLPSPVPRDARPAACPLPGNA